MTVINNKNISGITSINAQSNSLELFNSAGVSLLDLNTNSVTFPGNISGVGIGTDNPVQTLHLLSTLPIIRVQDSDGTDQFSQFFHSSSSTYIDNRNNTGKGSIFFRQYDGSSFVQSLQIDSQSNIGIGTDNPGIKVAVAGDVRVQNSTDASQYLTINHQGIDFQNTGAGSSTTSSAHLLDDYEEGTWTPGVEGLVTPGTYTITSAVGTYTKIGNQVTIVGRMDSITETVAGSSSVQITGLPFATANTSNFSIGTLELASWNIDNATNSVNCFALNNAVKLYARETRDGLGIANVNIADLISGSSNIRLTMTYLVD